MLTVRQKLHRAGWVRHRWLGRSYGYRPARSRSEESGRSVRKRIEQRRKELRDGQRMRNPARAFRADLLVAGVRALRADVSRDRWAESIERSRGIRFQAARLRGASAVRGAFTTS